MNAPRGAVLRRVAETRALQWWIDEQIHHGRADAEIAAALPVAAAFITGRLNLSDLPGTEVNA